MNDRKNAVEPDARVEHGDVEAELRRRGWIQELVAGNTMVAGEFLRVMQWAQKRFMSMAREFGAQEVLLPDMMHPRTTESSNYLHSFPHHAILARPAHEPDAESADAGRGPLLLTPTVCLNVFELLRGARLRPGELRMLVSTKRCFRQEVREGSVERLRNFTMLELVFFGPAEAVGRARVEIARSTAAVLEELDLVGDFRKATDPFFHQPENDQRRLFEERFGVKYELALPGPRGTIAASSFNLHVDFFTRRFDVGVEDGTTPWSGCVGFGLERWALAFFARHGLDPQRWPLALTTL